MQITDVRIRKVNDDGKMKAVVSVTFDDEFVVHDIKVIEGQNGLFIAMPSRKMGEGDFRDIAHPLTSETRNRIKTAIFEAYEKALEGKAEEASHPQIAAEEENHNSLRTEVSAAG
ncbi:MAG: septation regulator SpoVG [Eubacteriales bacterium]|nr:septation regulator SpoVG [Eubacteriales bacterium]MDD3350265.1 septation regulator SpoVG [Eubacteriales bacterium]